ncbi:hypothetical protein BDV95DRAFT_636244 [Massariosphaeria phaeospora]|uniref:Uncharacterized protein n=1 Tax=Massariosphaeria phaeospora TaxID=100035 RepID=A0A7C8M5R5_9PLEO|nr:hypothetical protein BDV95DRAFT_636244 [Massariosphaeria phaeospora]
METAVSNYDLRAKWHDLAPPVMMDMYGHHDEELPEARVSRLAMADSYREAIQILREKRRNAYVSAMAHANEKSSSLQGEEKMEWARKATHYAEHIDDQVLPAYGESVPFVTRSAIEAAQVTIYFARDLEIRLEFWKQRVNNDMIMTWLWDLRPVIDLRRLLDDPKYRTIWYVKGRGHVGPPWPELSMGRL